MQGLDLRLRRKRYGLTQEELGELIADFSLTNNREQAKPIRRRTINLWEHTDTVGNVGSMLEQVMDDIDHVYATMVNTVINAATSRADSNQHITLPARLAVDTLPHGMRAMILADAARALRAEGFTVTLVDEPEANQRADDESNTPK